MRIGHARHPRKRKAFPVSNGMDIFAHGLWTAAAAKAVNIKLAEKKQKLLSIPWTTFWGVFPDLFAFAIPFVYIFSGLLSGSLHLSDIPRPHQVEPPTAGTYRVIRLAQQLYNISHSAVIFAAVFLLAWLILRRPVWELCGWILHILIDIPTHSYQFYPTPVFWPLSSWKFTDGFSWSVPWFMIANYSAIVVVYYILFFRKRSKDRASNLT